MLAYGGEVDAGASTPAFLSFTCQPAREPWLENRARSAPVVCVLHVAGDAFRGQPDGVALAADHRLPGPACVHETTQILHFASRSFRAGIRAEIYEGAHTCTASAQRQTKQLSGRLKIGVGGRQHLGGRRCRQRQTASRGCGAHLPNPTSPGTPADEYAQGLGFRVSDGMGHQQGRSRAATMATESILHVSQL